MPRARINGQNVEVTKATVESPIKDVVYKISGEGAANLHATLKDVSANPSDIVDGSFTITRSDLRTPFMDMPFLKALDTKLDAAASGLSTFI
jgi:hypothetical protein